MRTSFVNKTLSVLMALMLLGFAAEGGAQDKPADNMQILRDKLKADKKLVVATNMELTESEAKGFWPIYEQYQKDLQKIISVSPACCKATRTTSAISRSPTKRPRS
jgi:hypothetical protein